MIGRVAIVMLGLLLMPAAGWAHFPGVVLSGIGTATIDGTMGVGEWDHAGRVDFVVNVPGGGTTPASMFVMNDRNSLYAAIRITRHPAITADLEVAAVLGLDSCHRAFDANSFTIVTTGTSFPQNIFIPDCSPVAPARTEGAPSGAVREDSQFIVFEFGRPLASNVDDFRARPGDTVGFALGISVVRADDPFNTSLASTRFPSTRPGDTISPLGDIVVAFPVRVVGSLRGTRLDHYVYAQNAGTDPTADLYFGMVFPDGRTVIFFGRDGSVVGAGPARDPIGFHSAGVVLPGGIFSEAFGHEIPTTLPAGDYILFVALVRPGALADNTIDPADVLAVDTSIVRLTR